MLVLDDLVRGGVSNVTLQSEQVDMAKGPGISWAGYIKYYLQITQAELERLKQQEQAQNGLVTPEGATVDEKESTIDVVFGGNDVENSSGEQAST